MCMPVLMTLTLTLKTFEGIVLLVSLCAPPGLLRRSDSTTYPRGVMFESSGIDFLFFWSVLVQKIEKGRITQINKVINVIRWVCHKWGQSEIISEL